MADDDDRRPRFYEFHSKVSKAHSAARDNDSSKVSSYSEDSIRKPLQQLKAKLNPLKRINLHKWFTDTRPVLEHVLFVRLQDINVTVSLNIPPPKRKHRKTYVPYERKSIFGLRAPSTYDSIVPRDSSNRKSILNKALDSYQKEDERARNTHKSKKKTRGNLEDEAAKLDRMSIANVSDEFESDKKSKVQFRLQRGQSLYESLVNYGLKGEEETETEDVENRATAKEQKRSGRKKKKEFLPKSVLKTRTDNTNTSMNSSPTTGSLVSFTWSSSETPSFHSPRNSLAITTDEEALKIDQIGSVKLWDMKRSSEDVSGNPNMGTRSSDKGNKHADATGTIQSRESRSLSMKTHHSKELRYSQARMGSSTDDQIDSIHSLESKESILYEKQTKRQSKVSTSSGQTQNSKGFANDNGGQKRSSINLVPGYRFSSRDKDIPVVRPDTLQEIGGSENSESSHTVSSIASTHPNESNEMLSSVGSIQWQQSRGSIKGMGNQNVGSSDSTQLRESKGSLYDKSDTNADQSGFSPKFDDKDKEYDMGKQSIEETIQHQDSRGSVKDKDSQNRDSSGSTQLRDSKDSLHDKNNINKGHQSSLTQSFDSKDPAHDKGKQSDGAIQPRESRGSVKGKDSQDVNARSSTLLFDNINSAHDKGKQSDGAIQPRESRGSVKGKSNHDFPARGSTQPFDNRDPASDKGKTSVGPPGSRDSVHGKEHPNIGSLGTDQQQENKPLDSSGSPPLGDSRGSIRNGSQGSSSIISSQPRESKGSNSNDVRNSKAGLSPFGQQPENSSSVSERVEPNKFSLISARSREDGGSRNHKKSFMDIFLKRESAGLSITNETEQENPSSSFHSLKGSRDRETAVGSNISFLSPRESKGSNLDLDGRGTESESSFFTPRDTRGSFRDQGVESTTSFFSSREVKGTFDDRLTGSNNSFFTPRSSIQTTGSAASFQSVKDLKDSVLERLKGKRHDKDSNQNADTEDEVHHLFTPVTSMTQQFQDDSDEMRPSMPADGHGRLGHTRDGDENELRWKLRAQVELMNDEISLLMDENADLQQSLMTVRTELTEKYDQENSSDTTSIKQQRSEEDSIFSIVFRIFVYAFACLMGISISKMCSL